MNLYIAFFLIVIFSIDNNHIFREKVIFLDEFIIHYSYSILPIFFKRL